MSKGTRRERECVELWNRAGFATYRPATVRFGENDMFGLFDVLAISPRHRSVHAIQVKSNRATGIRAWARHTRLFRELGWRTFYAVPVDREGWRVIELYTGPNGWDRETVVHEPTNEHVETLGDGVVDWLEQEAVTA